MGIFYIIGFIILIILAIKQRKQKYGDPKVAEEVKRRKEEMDRQYAEAEKLLDQDRLRNVDKDIFMQYLEIRLKRKKNFDDMSQAIPKIIKDLKIDDLTIDDSICYLKLNFGKEQLWGFVWMWIDRYLMEVIYYVFDKVTKIDTVFISGYRIFIDSKGEEKKLCFKSIKAGRDVAYAVKKENLTPSQVLTNFDTLHGVTIKKGKIISVRSIYSHEDLEKMSYPAKQEEKGAVTIDVINNILPEQFEQVVSLLLAKMNFIVEHTGQIGDGGIDIKAQNLSPMTAGKYIIQCKKYSIDNKVDVKDVRDLFGVVHSEMANKGILITTSEFTSKANEFAKGKPIELINGKKLEKLLIQFLPNLFKK